MSSSTNNEAISETKFKHEINEKMWEAFMAKKSVGKEACIACIKYLSDEDKKEVCIGKWGNLIPRQPEKIPLVSANLNALKNIKKD